jgi:hypothetical protein
MNTPRYIPLAVTLALLTSSVNADTLLIDAVDQAQTSNPATPRNGLSMSQVEARYGAPASKHGAVGDPPITRWDYPGYSVFFEYQTVLHSVVHHHEP